jgi:LacI family transcriptional regulator
MTGMKPSEVATGRDTVLAERTGKPTARKRGLTVKDVARVAGVAVGTVSRVLNDNATVMPDVREKVLAAMRELNYEPNAVARSMRAGATHVVGCIVSDVVQLTAAQMVTGAEQHLRDAGYAMFVASSRYDLAAERDIIRSFRQRKIDGLILVISDDEDPGYVAYLQGLNLPIVLWERDAGGLFNCVLSDHCGGCSQAAAYLLGLGHTRIALVAGHENTWVGREMLRGYIEAHAGRDIPVDRNLVERADKFDLSACTKLLTGSKRPTAIIAPINDLTVVMSVAKGLGLNVPMDLSVISVGDSNLISMTSPALTVVRHDPRQVGKTAAELLLSMLGENPPSEPRRLVFPAELVLRESCVEPKKPV